MVRTLLALAAVLPGGCDLLVDGALYNTHDVLVHNQGGQAVRVSMAWQEETDEPVYDPETGGETYWVRQSLRFDLAPGEQGRESIFRWAPIEVTVVRCSDRLVLYEESLSESDFEREHGTVEVVVFP